MKEWIEKRIVVNLFGKVIIDGGHNNTCTTPERSDSSGSKEKLKLMVALAAVIIAAVFYPEELKDIATAAFEMVAKAG